MGNGMEWKDMGIGIGMAQAIRIEIKDHLE